MYKMCSIIVLFFICIMSSAAIAGAVDASAFLDPKLPDCGIQRAVNSLGSEGGEVRLPAGRFELRRSIMLPSNVTLRGAGPEQSVLTIPKFEENEIFETIAPNQMKLAHLPSNLRVNTTVYVWPAKRAGIHRGAIQAYLVSAIDGDVITLDQPIVKHKAGVVSFGQSTLLVEPCVKGTHQLKVVDASIFRVGGTVSVGSGDGNANESLSFIKSIEGNTLNLERPILLDHPIDIKDRKRPAVWAIYPMITAENVQHITIADLSLEHPFAEEGRPLMARYTNSPIHLFNASDSLIQNVHVRNSCADGISLQQGSRIVVQRCVVTGCQGNGFHPGTGLRESIFEDCIARENGSGFYFCWANDGHIIRRCQFVNNGTGISGLGCPNDHHNIIEENLFANNRLSGLQINGGKVSGNVIRKNIFRDNGTATPGKYPGLLLEAFVEDARNYTIENNTFENTTSPGMQSVGIEERNGMYNKLPINADENVIRGNTFHNMATADVIYVGDKTVVDQPGAKIQRGLAIQAR